MPLLILLAAPTGAAAETNTGTGHREVKRPGKSLTVGVEDRLMSLDGLRWSPSRSLRDGELEGTADMDRSRWRDWTWSSVVRIGDDGCARNGSRVSAGSNFSIGGSIRIAIGDFSDPGGRRSHWTQAARIGFAGNPGASEDRLVDLFESDCD